MLTRLVKYTGPCIDFPVIEAYRKSRCMLSEIGSFEKPSTSNGKMAESEQLGLDKGIKTVKIYYETRNSRETVRRLKQPPSPTTQDCFELNWALRKPDRLER